ncbi:MAG: LuxR C-terminal-related transcriptional regulator [Chloroflexota bacterium]|nr:LuxR C-terminal-related transcriptional regulator [Chloroflexota bacterium]
MNDLHDPEASHNSLPQGQPLLGRRSRLPRPLSSLIGRETELAEIEARLSSGRIRLLTLTGPAGVGKTRLAIEIGSRLADRYRDGVRLVPLTLVDSPSQVVPAIGKAVGLRRAGTVGISEAIGALRDAQMLLLVDNFEHVIDAALDVSQLLTACPGVTALVTSRSILHITGEHVYPVPPMRHISPAAPATEILATDAAQLFIERARATKGDLELGPSDAATIAAICDRLEGMPLAIELAAAHAGSLSLNQMLERLAERLPVLTHGPKDQPERLQTMRAAISWGYELLRPHERRLLRRLALFEGGFGLEVLEVLLQADTSAETTPEDPLVVLERLVSQSLIRHFITSAGFSRYIILEVVREFLIEQIAAAGEAEDAEEIRLDACLEFGRHGAAYLIRKVDPTWLDRLEMEHATLKSALRWGFSSPARDAQKQAAQLAGHLWLFWYYHGHLATGRHWLELATRVTALDDADRARIHLGLGTILHYQGEMERAGVELAHALTIAEASDDRHLIAYVLSALGNHAEDLGQYATAEERFNAARNLFAQETDPVNVAVALYHLGVVAFGMDDLDLAKEHLRDALHLSRETEDPWSAGAALGWLGLVQIVQGEHAEAASSIAEALATYLRIGSLERVAELLRRTALLANARGQAGDAVQLFAAASTMSDRLGSPPELPESRIYEEALDALREQLPAHTFTTLWNTGRVKPQQEAVALAQSALGMDAAAALASTQPPRQSKVPLSDREIEVLRLLAEGRTDADIAEALAISRRTAATHVRHIYDKIGVTSRAAAAAWAVRNGVA